MEGDARSDRTRGHDPETTPRHPHETTPRRASRRFSASHDAPDPHSAALPAPVRRVVGRGGACALGVVGGGGLGGDGVADRREAAVEQRVVRQPVPPHVAPHLLLHTSPRQHPVCATSPRQHVSGPSASLRPISIAPARDDRFGPQRRLCRSDAPRRHSRRASTRAAACTRRAPGRRLASDDEHSWPAEPASTRGAGQGPDLRGGVPRGQDAACPPARHAANPPSPRSCARCLIVTTILPS